MVTLRRTVRFCINPEPPEAPDAGGGLPVMKSPGTAGANGYGGTPPMAGLGRYYELEIACRGEPDPRTGYLVNIKDIDLAARAGPIPRLAQACRESPTAEPARLLPELACAAQAQLRATLLSIRLRLTPTYSVEMQAQEPQVAVLRQKFDLAAAHRLHVPSLSDEENRRVFGRCNNASGHGHNYQIEPAVSVRLDGGALYSVADLERTTQRALIDPFDHTHLNKDTAVFAENTGANPSVENIARVFFEILAPAVRADSKGAAELRAITVWETDRTSCNYPG